jgi:hypothetical protein
MRMPRFTTPLMSNIPLMGIYLCPQEPLPYRNFISNFKMRNIFRTKKHSTSKGNTTEKTEPIDGRQARRGDHDGEGEDAPATVDGSSARAQTTAGMNEDPNISGVSAQAAPRTLAGPRPASHVEEDDAHSDVVRADTSGSDSAATAQDRDPSTERTVNILVGHHDPSSEYFTQRFVQTSPSRFPLLAHILGRDLPSTSTKGNGDRFRTLEDVDPHAFQMYEIWLHTGVLPSGNQSACFDKSAPDAVHTWRACWPLMNAHILGFKIGAYRFADHVMDVLNHRIGGICADVDTITHIFSTDKEKIPEVLRRFVVDRCIQSGVEGMKTLKMTELPPTFVHLMVSSAVLRLEPHRSEGPVNACMYHMHGNSICSTELVHPADKERAERHEAERAKTGTDAEDAAKNALENGVRTVGWQKRRAEAIQSHAEQTKLRWSGFSRPGDQRLGITETTGSSGAIADPTELAGGKQSSNSNSVLIKPPTRTTPPLPSPTNQDLDPLPEYEATVAESGQPTVVASLHSESSSQTLSLHSARSKPDSDLRRSLEMAVEYERRMAACPGSFPMS